MQTRKRWQFFLIIAVVVLTIYNILPTIIFYSKPLREPIGEKQAYEVAHGMCERVNELEEGARDWLRSFCDLIGVRPKSIQSRKDDPSAIDVGFAQVKDAALFRKLLPHAGTLIPFVPAQLYLAGNTEAKEAGDTVVVQRRVPIRFQSQEVPALFHFTEKVNAEGKITQTYFDLVSDRFAECAYQLAGPSSQAKEIMAVLEDFQNHEATLFEMARDIVMIAQTSGIDVPLAQRQLTYLVQNEASDQGLAKRFIGKMEEEKRRLELRVEALREEKKKRELENGFLETEKIELYEYLQDQVSVIGQAIQIMKGALPIFQEGRKPLTRSQVFTWLKEERKKDESASSAYVFDLGGRHPFVQQMVLDWGGDSIRFVLYPDVLAILKPEGQAASEAETLAAEAINRRVVDSMARLQRNTDETIAPTAGGFASNIFTLSGVKSLLAFDIRAVGGIVAKHVQASIRDNWHPTTADLVTLKSALFDGQGFTAASPTERRFCLYVAAPSQMKAVRPGLRPGSIYVIMRGFESVVEKYKKEATSEVAGQFQREFDELAHLLQQQGFIGYFGSTLGEPELARDFVFELDDYYSIPLKATREQLSVLGGKKYAVLEFTDVEQRIRTQNRIEEAIQEDLLRWKETYQAAQVDPNPAVRYTVPKPTESVYVQNTKRAIRAYFRGDDSKVLKWGLDLSGGKTVRLCLLDTAQKTVVDPQDLQQAISELNLRLNKMGVSQRTIRLEGSTILIDFPGSQNLSANELIKAPSMYFHIVNEQFGPYNTSLAKEVNAFLQDVWNEAVVTNQKEAYHLNEIAHGKLEAAAREATLGGVKDAAQMLLAAGLRIADPKTTVPSSTFNDSLSMVARLAGDDPAEWGFRSHPLLITFHNYTLDGSSLDNIQTSYDPSKGNMLLFDVKNSYASRHVGGTGSPQDDFFVWTSQFSEEKIVGTPRETYSQGHGWRMAVVLNGIVVSQPHLNAALKDHAMITGSFSHREITKLASDLRAGSLSFTPKILSEHNVSPELGQEARHQGITAAIIGVVLVVISMVSYYHFGGVVASIAVLFNILVIWAVMQNIDAAITLSGLAGIVLTVGMAVDANVLVFERIREEFAISKRLASAIQAGYQKAFSAIVDSNLTTILAALILLQFDCGPIRGFVMTLIIGIASSMFTSLFMTRYFFIGWVRNPLHKELKMANWIRPSHFDFLKRTKTAFVISALLAAVGLLALAGSWKSMFGIDFTGGYSITIEFEEPAGVDTRERAAKALEARGLSSGEFQIRELGRKDLLRFQLAIGLEESGRPFHALPEATSVTNAMYPYENNPRIVWLVEALTSEGLKISPASLLSLNSSWTAMSGQVSGSMRNNAIIALVLALVAVLVYLMFRFEWEFAASALFALIHDVVLTAVVAAIAHRLGAPVQFDLEAVGAFMTIIGYSLNDTIIVFDRIREDMRTMKRRSFPEIINHALNSVLARTILTSGTTFLVLLALLCFGGRAIFGFSFIMGVGVFLGTLSSLFIACPVLLYLETRKKGTLQRDTHEKVACLKSPQRPHGSIQNLIQS